MNGGSRDYASIKKNLASRRKALVAEIARIDEALGKLDNIGHDIDVVLAAVVKGKRPRTACPKCGKDVTVKDDGNVYFHAPCGYDD